MKKAVAIFDSEDGFVLVLSLVVLLLLVALGVAALQNTGVEVEIAANDKFHKIAFYRSDGGIFMTPKVISHAIDTGADPAEGGLIALLGVDSATASDGTRFYNEIMGFVSDGVANDPDMQITLGGVQVNVDVTYAGREPLPGGGAEFASGSSGLGAGSPGGVAINYDLTSIGSGPSNSVATIGARYRKVPGTAGGL